MTLDRSFNRVSNNPYKITYLIRRGALKNIFTLIIVVFNEALEVNLVLDFCHPK